MSAAMPDQCPRCGKAIVDQQPPVLVDGKVATVAMVTLLHPDNTKCSLPGSDVPWLYQRQPILWQAPTSTQAHHSEKLDAVLEAHVDRLMQETLQRLHEAGLPAIGILVGIMHDGETSATWIVSDEARGDDGEPAPPQSVARQIALDLVSVTARVE